MMYYYNDYFSPLHFFFGPIFMVIIWAFIIWGIVSLVKHFSKHSTHDHTNSIHILKERYAKGEITKEQFETMKKDIQ